MVTSARGDAHGDPPKILSRMSSMHQTHQKSSQILNAYSSYSTASSPHREIRQRPKRPRPPSNGGTEEVDESVRTAAVSSWIAVTLATAHGVQECDEEKPCEVGGALGMRRPEHPEPDPLTLCGWLAVRQVPPLSTHLFTSVSVVRLGPGSVMGAESYYWAA
jgi:hypothetical protein